MRLGRRLGQYIGNRLGRIVGGFRGLLMKYPGATAAYSLRKIGSGPVVRLRRASDNAEKDFYAGEVAGGVEGSEELINGDFSNGSTGWTLSGWSIVGEQAVADAAGGLELLDQHTLDDQQAGDYIKVTFDLVACSDFANCGMQINSTSLLTFGTSLQINSTGTFSFLFYYDTKVNNRFRFYANNSASMTIDNVSVVPYTPTAAELWVLNGANRGRQTTDSAYATTWYNQAGSGNDATQATAASQPLLIRAGVTNTENGKPALSFDGVDDYLTGSSVPMLGNDWAAFATYAPLSTAGQGLFESVDASSVSNRIVVYSSSGTSPDNAVNYAADGTNRFAADTIDKTSGQQYLRTATYDGSNVVPYLDGVVQTSVAASGVSTSLLDQFTIGRQTVSNLYADANIQELVIYDSDQSANRTGIEENIADGWCMPYPTKPIVSECMPTPAAAYSLRSLDGSTSTNVVRLRRASDNAERDFTAADLAGGVEGSDVVTNGDFATDSDWTKDTGWSITGGQAVCDGTQVGVSQLRQNGIISSEAGAYYKITFTIVACSDINNAGTVIDSAQIQKFTSEYGINTTGTYSLIFKTTGTNTNFRFFASAGVTFTLDDVSCVEYTPTTAELWALNDRDKAARQAAESAYVTTLYDQASTNDATQSTAAAQPKLITAGVTELENGKPAMVFDGTDDYLINEALQATQATTFFSVAELVASMRLVTGTDAINRQLTYVSGNVIALYAGGFVNTGSSVSADFGNQTVITSVFNGASSAIYRDGASYDTGNAGAGNLDGIIIGASYTFTAFNNGRVQEVIVYDSDQSANRTILETNINDHYGIY